MPPDPSIISANFSLFFVGNFQTFFLGLGDGCIGNPLTDQIHKDVFNPSHKSPHEKIGVKLYPKQFDCYV